MAGAVWRVWIRARPARPEDRAGRTSPRATRRRYASSRDEERRAGSRGARGGGCLRRAIPQLMRVEGARLRAEPAPRLAGVIEDGAPAAVASGLERPENKGAPGGAPGSVDGGDRGGSEIGPTSTRRRSSRTCGTWARAGSSRRTRRGESRLEPGVRADRRLQDAFGVGPTPSRWLRVGAARLEPAPSLRCTCPESFATPARRCPPRAVWPSPHEDQIARWSLPRIAWFMR